MFDFIFQKQFFQNKRIKKSIDMRFSEIKKVLYIRIFLS